MCLARASFVHVSNIYFSYPGTETANLSSGWVTWTSYPHSGACLIPLAEAVYDLSLLFQAQGVMNCLVIHLHYVNLFYFSHTIQPALAYPSYGACCSGLTRVAGPGRAGSARSGTAQCTPYNAATHYCCFINTDGVLEACLVGARHLVRRKCLRVRIGLWVNLRHTYCLFGHLLRRLNHDGSTADGKQRAGDRKK